MASISFMGSITAPGRLVARTAPEVTERVRPPRARSVPHPLGHPFGRPSDPMLQRRILVRLLRVLLLDGAPSISSLGAATPEEADLDAA
jgi:hypothetical protein